MLVLQCIKGAHGNRPGRLHVPEAGTDAAVAQVELCKRLQGRRHGGLDRRWPFPRVKRLIRAVGRELACSIHVRETLVLAHRVNFAARGNSVDFGPKRTPGSGFMSTSPEEVRLEEYDKVLQPEELVAIIRPSR